MPKVSVLMPAYNAAQWIADAIDSILRQTFSDFEFIIINDGSTDDTARVVREYATRDPRIKFIDNIQNRGVAHIRNQLLDMATGEYIAFQDADDISHPNRLDTQVRFMDAHHEVSVCGTGMHAFPSDEIVICPQCPKILDFYTANMVSNPTVMMRRRKIDAHKLRFNPDFTTAEDYDFWARLVRELNIYNIPDILLEYRIVQNSLSHNNPRLDYFNNLVRTHIIDSITTDKITRIRLSPKYCAYLFGVVPVIKFKRTRIYLFGVIPLMKLRGNWWRLFDVIPLVKIK